MPPRDDHYPHDYIVHKPPMNRPLEPEELQDYREYWPDNKKLVIHYRFVGQLWWFLKRFIYFAGIVLGVIWTFRDLITQMITVVFGHGAVH